MCFPCRCYTCGISALYGVSRLISSAWVGCPSSNHTVERSSSSASNRRLDGRLRLLDRAETTEKELQADMILGPLVNLSDVPIPTVRLLRRLGTWEEHGGAQEPTVRLIDDALEGGQNGATGSQYTYRPTDLDTWATQSRMVQELVPSSALSPFPSDFKQPYNQVPTEPNLAGLAVMVKWHPHECRLVFLAGRTIFLLESLAQ